FLVVGDQIAKPLHARSRRIDIGHAYRKSDAAGGRCHRRSSHVLLVCESRISVMGVGVDESGNNFSSRGIDNGVGAVRQNRWFTQPQTFTLPHGAIRRDESSRRPNFAVLNEQFHFIHWSMNLPSPRLKKFLYDRQLPLST